MLGLSRFLEKERHAMSEAKECDLATEPSDCSYCCARCAVQVCPFRCTRENAERCEHRRKDAKGRGFLHLVA